MKNKKTIWNIISALTMQVVIFVTSFIVKKIIIKEYGSNLNGLISSITQFLSYIALLESGVGPVIKASLYKPISKHDEKEINNILYASEKFFRKIAIIFLIYIIILSFVYPIFIGEQFSYWYTFSLIIIISISTFFEYYFGMTYKLYLQSDQKTYIVSLIQIGGYILNLILVLILVHFGSNIHILKLITSISYIIRPILQNIIVKKMYNIDLKKCDKNYKLKQKWDGLAQHIASVIHTNTDITILTIFSTLGNVSIYSVYATVTAGLRQVIQSFNDSIESFFGNMLALEKIEDLKNKFNIYETIFYAILTILYSCGLVLITPFVKVFTLSITDLNYSYPLFGYVLIVSEIIWAIRQPYNNLIKSAGHFKQTRIGAWIEASVNIVVSIFLVKKYGLIGVAIGTTTAMIVRTTEFIIYSNKNILKRSNLITIKKNLLMLVEFVIIFIFSKYVIVVPFTSYINWIINALCVFVLSFVITTILNLIVNKDLIKNIQILKKGKK